MPSYVRDEHGNFKLKQEFFSEKILSSIQTTARLNKILSDFTKLKILYLLTLGEVNVTKIKNEVRKSQSLISHHLATLRRENLVTTHRKSKMVYYSLSSLGKSLLEKYGP